LQKLPAFKEFAQGGIHASPYPIFIPYRFGYLLRHFLSIPGIPYSSLSKEKVLIMKNNHNQATGNHQRFIPKIEPVLMAHWATATCVTKEPIGKQEAHFNEVNFDLRHPPLEEETEFSKN
jgi:hypothetical protein